MVEGALEEVEIALQEKPGDPEALLTRARIKLQAGDREGARRDLLAAVTTGGAPYRARALLENDFRAIIMEPVAGSGKDGQQP